MSSFKINYKQIRHQPSFSEMMSALERGFEKFGIDFYLIGAIARDVWMQAHQIPLKRATADIDFAVLINKKESYEVLKKYLIETEGFNEFKENAFVLLWKDRTPVDLLPFGAIEDEDGNVTVTGTGFTTIKMPGFKEVYEEGLPELELEGKHQFKFCTLPGIVVLKLIAWDDRPEIREKDIKDICDIINHFFEIYADKIYEFHNDIFEGKDDNIRHIAAKVMGREIKKIAQRNDKLFTRIESILVKNTINKTDSKMAEIMVKYFRDTIEDNVILIDQLKAGFQE